MSDDRRNAALGRLTSGALHEINNMLGALSGSVAMIRHYAGVDSRLLGVADVAEKSVERAGEIARSVLTLLRKTNRRRDPVQTALLLDDAARELAKRDLAVAVHTPSYVPQFPGDHEELRDALIAACSALTASFCTPSGAPRAPVTLAAGGVKTADGERVLIMASATHNAESARRHIVASGAGAGHSGPSMYGVNFAGAITELNGGSACFRFDGTEQGYFGLLFPVA